MPSTVMLHEAWVSSPSLAKCPPGTQDRFPRYLIAADWYGCFEANCPLLKGKLFALRHDMETTAIQADLEAYVQSGMLEVWEEHGRTWGFWRSWSLYNRTRLELKRKTPVPPSVRKFKNLAGYIKSLGRRELAANSRNLAESRRVRSVSDPIRFRSDPDPDRSARSGSRASGSQSRAREVQEARQNGLNAQAAEVLRHLSEKSGFSFPAAGRPLRLVLDRFAEGLSVEDLRAVVEDQAARFRKDPRRTNYLQPGLLFGDRCAEFLAVARGRLGELTLGKCRVCGKTAKTDMTLCDEHDLEFGRPKP